MVDRANHRFDGLGGHLSTYASAAALYEVGFNHFFRGKGDGGYGDQVFFQGHAAPGIYARAFLEGRLTEEQLDHFRREVGGQGLPSYPHPRRMPTFWEFPTVSMGLGPLNAVYQARFNRYLYNRELVDTSKARVWCFVGDGEIDEPESIAALAPRVARTARQPDLRRQLQPAAPRRSGARQRQGDPGVRVDVPRHGLERDQGRSGAAQWDDLLARDVDGVLVNKMNTTRRRRVPEVRGRVGRVHPGALLRARPAAAQDGRAPHRRRAAASCRAAATTTASSTRRTRPRSSTKARRR